MSKEEQYQLTIKERQDGLKEKFLNALREIPLTEYACKKAGISRTTYYRWRDSDEEFRRERHKAEREGREFVNDMSETVIIQLLKEQHLPAARFWLTHNKNRYGARMHESDEYDESTEQPIYGGESIKTIPNTGHEGDA